MNKEMTEQDLQIIVRKIMSSFEEQGYSPEDCWVACSAIQGSIASQSGWDLDAFIKAQAKNSACYMLALQLGAADEQG